MKIYKEDPTNVDLIEFETTYKQEANDPGLNPVPQTDIQGRWIIKTDSRPTNWDIVFSGCGDDVAMEKFGEEHHSNGIFSIPDGFIDAPTGFKRKRINWGFLDAVYRKKEQYIIIMLQKEVI